MPRKPKLTPRVFDKQDFQKILYAILTRKVWDNPRYKFFRLRDATWVFLGVSLGLRPKEIRCMKLCDVNLTKQLIYIPAENNKQRNQDYLPILGDVYQKLFTYISIRDKFFRNSPWLFPTKKGCIDRSHFSKIFRNALKTAGLLHIAYNYKNANRMLNRYNYNTYSLRHSFATNCAEEIGFDIIKLSILLRHKDWQHRSTLRYLHTCQDKTREEIFKAMLLEK